MASLFDATRTGRVSASRPGTAATVPARTPTQPRTNSVTASQARAARRREARRDEQAVAAWLRELAGRSR
jgi:hypothetical protein